jgi:hypothetical protein
LDIERFDVSDKPIKLYLAILNKGWIRRETDAFLTQMRNTEGVELVLHPLNRSYHNPIFANRNILSKAFLETDCDFHMQIDDDVVPIHHNPAQLVFADKDVIGCPAKVRQYGKSLNWVAFVKHPTEEGYAPVDFSTVDDTIDLLEVAVVGTGMILIKRNVLETLWKQDGGPFTVELDKFGVPDFGTDFAFCRRVTAAGFKVYTTPQRLCEHFKEFGLLDIMGYDDSDSRDPTSHKYGIPWGEWAIAQKDWEFIRNIIQREEIKTILEFGSGLSSLLLSEFVEVISYETDDEWQKCIEEKKVPGLNNLSLRKWSGVDEPTELEGKKFDLVFVDGPPGKVTGGPGREVSIRLATKLSDRIILHDAQRAEEFGLQMKFLRGVFKLAARSGYYSNCCHYWLRKVE